MGEKLGVKTTAKKAGGYISCLQFNNGQSVDISQDDIVIFVGPNNAGKSQSLRDIYSLCEDEKNTSTVISKVIITKSDEKLEELLDKLAVGYNDSGTKVYKIMGQNFFLAEYTEENFRHSQSYDNYRNLFVANLDTAARLKICDPVENIARNEPKRHPIQYAAFDGKYRKWLSDNFKRAFGIEITPNIHFGAKIPLCMGELVRLEDKYEDEQSRQEAYAGILATYPQVQDQGDGIKSFTGILLYLMLDHYCTYLIDEPESFLHPPQARIMGQIIGQALSNQQQAFISTHSEDIIKGLMDVCSERLKIIRITREDDKNGFSVLDNEHFGEIWKDPLLKHSNIMSGLFHRTVVLCESDSDCKMYSIIESYLKQQQGKYSETLFIHCGGKHRMAKTVKALRALNVDVKLITDIDVLDDESIFRGITESFDVEWSIIQHQYKIFVSNLHSSKEVINRNSALEGINRVFKNSSETNLSEREIKEIREILVTTSKWKEIKRGGVNAIPSGNATVAYREMEKVLKSHGIFVVPVGELECFVKEIGGHGPEWTNNVLEAYPDLSASVYDSIKEFIGQIQL